MRKLALVLSAAAVVLGHDAPSQATIRTAVQRGVAWLLKEQKGGGSFGTGPGETALALLALRHSGLPARDRACLRAARYLERSLPDGTVYGAALGILALLEQDLVRHRPKIEKLVKHLARGQCRNGQWTYAYRATSRKRAGDNSNTQMAILALGAARVRRVAVPESCFAKLHAFLRASQNKDGGFGYAQNQRTRSYGSMTAGGAMALALCAAPKRPTELTEVRRALHWLGTGFDPAENKDAGLAFGRRGDSLWKHYWLWSVERAGSACGADRLGVHDWYTEGANHLLASQKKDGSWRDPERALLATSFALLFFSRSTKIVLTPHAGDVVVTPGAR